jgi:hypothetical protein
MQNCMERFWTGFEDVRKNLEGRRLIVGDKIVVFDRACCYVGEGRFSF